MNRLIKVVIVLLFPMYSYAIRVINDSPGDLTVHTYNMADQSYAIQYSTKVVKYGASANIEAHDNGRCKLQMWVSVDGHLGQRLIAPGRIYTNAVLIIVNEDLNLDVTPDGQLPLYPVPNRTPNPPKSQHQLCEGEGFSSNGGILSQDGRYSFTLTNGSLKIKNASGNKVYWDSKTSDAEYVIYLSGLLFLYKSAASSHQIVAEFGNYRPHSTLSFVPGAFAVESKSKQGYWEWTMVGKAPKDTTKPKCPEKGTKWCECSQECTIIKFCDQCDSLTKKLEDKEEK